ncbi:hypothetical protein [Pseudoduganella violaceinigra]|uniref:hypothetical protein n=1 Tax=Pseudoduganella violaceinigra TaxID=246602 RepID=UPI00041C54A5|nr:hypothetical protein [Pseudoduganella violaceinigra]
MNRQTLESILDLARWAPSGDNVQSHEFEIAGPDHVVVYGHDTSADTVYDLDGHSSQLAFGALLETMAIAATAHGLATHCTRRQLADEKDRTRCAFDVRFSPDPAIVPSALLDAIPRRSVQRRPMRTTPLSDAQRRELEAAVGPGYRLRWLSTFGERWQAARLMFHNAKLRLTMPEAYEVHARIIDWGKQFSETKVPDQALGVDNATLKLMHWAMQSWQRMARMNAILGTSAARLQMDLLPGLACAAHVVLLADQPLRSIDDYVAGGRAVQRFWLTATRLGFFMQPEMTPLIFARYLDAGREDFTRVRAIVDAAKALRPRTAMMAGNDGFPVFMARIGAGPAPAARSIRKPLSVLLRN